MDCNNKCDECQEECADRKETDFRIQLNKLSNVKKVIGVMSGKGGVGKSLVTSLLATTMQKKGYRTAILDADITGPSITQTFGIEGKTYRSEFGIYPAISDEGIQIMSTNMLLNDPTEPVVWRSPIIVSMVQQFWTDVIWDDVDYMFVDLPPGTGDVPLTVFQALPLDGVVIVGTPQDLVGSIVEKSINMVNMMNLNIIGYVENMSYFICDECNKKHYIFSNQNAQKLKEKYDLKIVNEIPMDIKLRQLVDAGKIEEYDIDVLNEISNEIEEI